eukprot:CAMPEP_0181311894 /NCGR_PEP_ID=MMETSP1101-20121128/13396_1 /TAXON_ID=46948 /ORGANISM="Rhodomonas abbreviata, Strain Caron Lab Isolate" /LENGTH=609 /DNA_ID=CAMNT_0023418687 /DNA_START=165 /DNA_END=1991 /DNA_ORIENTATION=+
MPSSDFVVGGDGCVVRHHNQQNTSLVLLEMGNTVDQSSFSQKLLLEDVDQSSHPIFPEASSPGGHRNGISNCAATAPPRAAQQSTEATVNVQPYSFANQDKTDEMIVTIDCGGKIHRAYVRTLRRLPRTRLCRMVSEKGNGGCGELLKTGFLFLDRHPKCFAAVLNYYRTDRLIQPPGVTDDLWANELRYYMVKPPVERLPTDEEIEEQQQSQGKPRGPSYKLKLWLVLEDASSSRLAKCWALFSMSIVVFATLIFIIESLPQFHDGSDYAERSLQTFENLETGCISFFTVEFLLRLWVTDKRLMFMTNIMNLIDFIAILPFYTKFLPLGGDSGSLTVLRVIRLVKVFRIFRFGRYSTGLRLLLHAVSQSRGELGIMFLFLVMGIVLFGSAVYFTEMEVDCDSEYECFDSIPHSMWWAIITMSTVGYGDMSPKTGSGKLVASLCVVCGVVMLGGPISVMSSNFGEKYSEVKKQQAAVRERERLRRSDMQLAAFRGKSALSDRLSQILRQNPQLSSTEGFELLLQQVFGTYDHDGSGVMEEAEVSQALSSLGVEMEQEGFEMLLRSIDVNNDGVLDYAEFRAFAARATLEAGSDLQGEVHAMLEERVEEW